MSTEIRSSETERRLRLTRSGDEVILWLDDMNLDPEAGRFMVEIRHFRADFLAAVADECGVIVIDRADLPEVKASPVGIAADGAGGALTINATWTAEQVRADARAMLALAEHLDAHPPVDEVQVEALAATLSVEDRERNAAGPDVASWADIARRLIVRGVRIEVRP